MTDNPTNHELQQKVHILEGLVNTSKDVIYILSPAGTITYINDAWQYNTGYSKAECLEKHFSGLVHPADLSSVQEKFQNVISTRAPAVIECRYRHKTGEYRWSEFLLTPKIINHRVDHVVGIARDITDKKRSEAALRESKVKYRHLFEIMTQGVVIQDAEGEIIETNHAACEILGLSIDQIFGRTACASGWKLIQENGAPYDPNELPPNIALRTGKPVKDVLCGIYVPEKDAYRWIMLSSTPQLREEENTPLVVMTVCADITENKLAEIALRNSEERYRAIFQNSPIGIFQSTFEGRFLEVNTALAKILGYDSPEAVISSIYNISEQIYVKTEHRQKIVSEKMHSSDITHYINHYRRKDGTGFIANLYLKTLFNEHGKPDHFIGIVQDITEQKKAEKKIQQCYRELERRIEERTSKLRSLSSDLLLTEDRERRQIAEELHDNIGQELAIVKIKLAELKKSELSSSHAKSLKDISQIIEQVIQETRSLTFDISPPILYEFGFESALDWFIEGLQNQSSIHFEIEAGKQIEKIDNSLNVLLFRVTRELIFNITKHSRAKKATISIQKIEKNIRIIIEDDGVGFNTREIEQFANNRKQFGLFSIKERLTHIGGHFDIKSEPGQGSRFTLIVPLTH